MKVFVKGAVKNIRQFIRIWDVLTYGGATEVGAYFDSSFKSEIESEQCPKVSIIHLDCASEMLLKMPLVCQLTDVKLLTSLS